MNYNKTREYRFTEKYIKFYAKTFYKIPINSYILKNDLAPRPDENSDVHSLNGIYIF